MNKTLNRRQLTVMLKDFSTTGGLYTVETDEPATLAELKKGTVVGREAKGAAMGWQIEFIGPQGKVLQSTRTPRASFPITKDNAYIRCKVTFVRNTSTGSEAYYAWTQPLFPR